MNGTDTLDSLLSRYQRRAFAIGAAAFLLTLAGAAVDPSQFCRSYLTGYLLWFGIALGAVAVVALSHLVGGVWGLVTRRLMEAAARTIPLTALLFIPVLAGMRLLYPWSRPEVVAHDELIQRKAAYLNVPSFIGRAIIYFGCWLLLAHFLAKWSVERDETGDPSLSRKLRALSAGGIVLYVLTASFASIDWVVSLEPYWYSSIFGAMFVTGQGLSTLAFAIVVLSILAAYRPLSDLVSRKLFNDLGNLLLTFVMLWAYMAFSQYLIIWSGNLQIEIPWYVRRMNGGWAAIGLALIILHFAVPFVLLLSRQVKQNARYVSGVAVGVLFMRWVAYYWMVEPPFESAGPRLHWLDVTAPIGIGGLWLAAYFRRLKQNPLLPRGDPQFEEVVARHEEV